MGSTQQWYQQYYVACFMMPALCCLLCVAYFMMNYRVIHSLDGSNHINKLWHHKESVCVCVPLEGRRGCSWKRAAKLLSSYVHLSNNTPKGHYY